MKLLNTCRLSSQKIFADYAEWETSHCSLKKFFTILCEKKRESEMKCKASENKADENQQCEVSVFAGEIIIRNSEMEFKIINNDFKG